MTSTTHDRECDLLIIGSGMAGMAAAFFAARRQIDTVQVGVAGEINLASGMLDLLGVHPVDGGHRLVDPWEGLHRLQQDCPRHPYALLPVDTIRTAFDLLLDFLHRAHLPYMHLHRRNVEMITPVGTVKTTYALPETMAAGIRALAEKWPVLLVDFHGLKGYSAIQIKEAMSSHWPGLETLRLFLPDLPEDLFAERMARWMEMRDSRRWLADAIAPHLGRFKAVALPAVLGVYRSQDVAAEIGGRLGLPVFEIPTMPPGATGLRLREAFESHLPAMGVRTFYQHRAAAPRRLADGRFRVELRNDFEAREMLCRSVLLATGRFYGRGLAADRSGIRESLFGLSVHQPPGRTHWHQKDFLHPAGHPVNRAGVTVDHRFRPTDGGGSPRYDNLAAAGSVLAHQDWMREKCGSGLAIATAFGAVESLCRHLAGQ